VNQHGEISVNFNSEEMVAREGKDLVIRQPWYLNCLTGNDATSRRSLLLSASELNRARFPQGPYLDRISVSPHLSYYSEGTLKIILSHVNNIKQGLMHGAIY